MGGVIGEARESVITTMLRPRRDSSSPASAWAGNKCPPVPPAERTTQWGPRSCRAHPKDAEQLQRFFPRADFGPLARHRQAKPMVSAMENSDEPP